MTVFGLAGSSPDLNVAQRRRPFLKLGATMAAAQVLGAQAQDKPTLRIIVPLPAGGVADASLRFFAEAWTNLTKQIIPIALN